MASSTTPRTDVSDNSRNSFSSMKRRRRYAMRTAGVTAVGAATLVFFAAGSSVAQAATPIDLATATSFAVLAGTTITNTGATTVTGDIGVSPGSAITGFPPGTVSGTTHTADAAAISAETSSTAAYIAATGETPFTTVAAGTLGGVTFTPGSYTSAGALSLTGTVTLNGEGDQNSVFILLAGSTLTTATSSSVVLENGAQACNVFWIVGSSATLGTSTSFAGTILALTSITLNTGASDAGRLQAQTGAVTLDDNSVTVPTCAAVTTTTTAATPTTTTTVATVAATTTTTVHHAGSGPLASAGGTGTGTTTGGVVPVGAPATGEGGTAGSSNLGALGLGALALATVSGALAVRSFRSRRSEPGHDVHGS
jgi:Ice-binding-like